MINIFLKFQLNGNPLQYLEPGRPTVHGVAESDTTELLHLCLKNDETESNQICIMFSDLIIFSL